MTSHVEKTGGATALSKENKRIRVLHVLNELKPSGAEVMLRVAAPYWVEANVQCEILTIGDQVGPYAQVLTSVGYQLHQLSFTRSASFVARFFRFLRTHRFDVVHIHTERANFWLGCAAVLAGVPRVVRSIHSVFSFPAPLRLVRTAQRTLLRLLGITHVGVSSSVQIAERENFRNNAVYIPNWYDPKITPPSTLQRGEARRALGIKETDIVLVTIGNCSQVKNHSLLLRALSLLPKDMSFVYLHVGQEQDGLPERSLAAELGLEAHTRFMGYAQDILPVLHAADVFVMPSTHEGLGIAAMEAMAAGLPVVLTDVPGLRDFRQLGEGVTCVNSDVQSLMMGLSRVADLTTAERCSIGLTLAEQVQGLYGVNRGVDGYLALYRPRRQGVIKAHSSGVK